jgi:Family of unknown function (DUF6062)
VASVAKTTSKRKPAWFARTALERGLAEGGCLVCKSLQHAAGRYIFSFLYEGMMSGSARETFLKGGGFCHDHFWQAKQIETKCWADGFGVAILCENLVQKALEDVKRMPERRVPQKSALLGYRNRSREQPIQFALAPGSGCTVCAVLSESENHQVMVLEELLEEPDFATRYQQSPGLCFYHLRMTAGRWQSPVALSLAKSTAERVALELITELREFQRKHDYQYRHEPRGAESTAAERAIQFLVGLNCDNDDLAETPATELKRG